MIVNVANMSSPTSGLPLFCCVSVAQSFGEYQICIISSHKLFVVIAICCLLNTLTCNMASVLTFDVEDNLSLLSSLDSVSDKVIDV
jgi:hypothetical protein